MFSIAPQLLIDCHKLGQRNKIHYLLHKNALLHWFILVPETNETLLLNLEAPLLKACLAEAKIVNDYLIHTLQYPHSNFANIGNVVSQLHLHVVGRSPDDACWPKPVWGNLAQSTVYSQTDIQHIISDLHL